MRWEGPLWCHKIKNDRSSSIEERKVSVAEILTQEKKEKSDRKPYWR